jgi:Zn-dependent oligopeptidase
MTRPMVYAADLYSNVFAEDQLSSTAGRRYRYMVLEPGSSQSDMGTVENFLARKLNSPFLSSLLKAKSFRTRLFDNLIYLAIVIILKLFCTIEH